MTFFAPVAAASPQQAADAAGPLCAPTLIFAGDSMTADSQMGTPPYGGVTTYTASHVTWLRWLTGRRFYTDPGLVFGTAGFTTAQWIATHMANCVAAVVAARAKGSLPVVVLRLGTNNLTAGNTLAAITADFETILNALHAAGAVTVAYLTMPRGGANVLSATAEKVRHGLNNYLAGKARSNSQRVIPFDPIPYVVDVATGAMLAAKTRDGLHGTAQGYAAEASALAAILVSLAPPTYCGFLDVDDIFDATSNPYGSKLPNGIFAGTGGNKANGVAGTVANSWYASLLKSDGSTAAASLTATGSSVLSAGVTNLPMQQFVMGGTAGSGELLKLYQGGVAISGYAVGDLVEMEVDVEWDAGLTGIAAVLAILNANYAAQSIDGAGGAAYGPLPSAATKITLSTPPIAMTAAVLAGNLNFAIQIVGTPDTSAVAATIRVSQARIRKLPPT